MGMHVKTVNDIDQARREGRLDEAWLLIRPLLLDRADTDDADIGNVANRVWWDHFVGRFSDLAADLSPTRVTGRCVHAANLIWDITRQHVATRDHAWFDATLPDIAGVCRHFITNEEGWDARDHLYGNADSERMQQANRLLDASVALALAARHLIADVDHLPASFVQCLVDALRHYVDFLASSAAAPLTVTVPSKLDAIVRFAAVGTDDWRSWCRTTIRYLLDRLYEASLSAMKSPAQDDLQDLSSALAMAEHGLRWLLDDPLAEGDTRATTVLFAGLQANHDQGRFADIVVRALAANVDRPLPARYGIAFYPDPVWLGLTVLDAEWLRGFRLAHQVACQQKVQPGGCTWRLKFPSNDDRQVKSENRQESSHQRPTLIEGASASAAACCTLIALAKSLPLDRGTAITAELLADGSLQDVSSKIAKLLGFPVASGTAGDAELEKNAHDTLEGLRPYIRHVLVKSRSDWLERAGKLRQIQIQEANSIDEALALMSGRLEKVLEFLDLLAKNGLIQNFPYRPPGLAPADVAEFCLPVRVVDEDQWQRLENERSTPSRRGADDRDYVFAQSEEFWRMDGERRVTPQRLENVLRSGRRVVIRGEPGEGKTTSLYLHVAHRCRELARGLRSREFGLDSPACRIPLPLPLSKVPPTEADQPFSVISQANPQALQSAYGLNKKAPEEVADWLKTKIERGEIDLHLDALDELDDRWYESLGKELAAADPGRTSEIGVFMTTRMSADDTRVMKVPRYRMVCFGPAQVRNFITRYFAKIHNGEQLAQELRDRLKLSPGPRHLAQIPLLLTLLCETKVAWPNKPLPETRTTLLQFALHSLLERGDARRGQPVDDSPTERNQIKEAILRHVAWRFFAKGPVPILKKELLPILDTQLGRFAGDKHGQPRNATALLKEFLGDGVLVRQEEGVYRFVLRSLHEYALAGWIACESHHANCFQRFLAMIRGRATSWHRPDWGNMKPLNQSTWSAVWPLIPLQMTAHPGWIPHALVDEHHEFEDLFDSRLLLLSSVAEDLPHHCGYREQALQLLAARLKANRMIRHNDSFFRAYVRLGGSTVLPYLRKLHDSKDFSISNFKEWTNALSIINSKESIGILLAVLRDGTADNQLRLACAESLECVDPTEEIVSTLRGLVSRDDNSSLLPWKCTQALMAIARPADESFFRSILADPHFTPGTRAVAAQALAAINEKVAIPLLQAVLFDAANPTELRTKCVSVLAELCDSSTEDVLIAILQDPHHDNEVRYSCAKALSMYETHRAKDILTRQLQLSRGVDSDWSKTLVTTRSNEPNVTPSISLRALKDSTAPLILRRECVRALQSHRGDDVTTFLASILSDTEWDIFDRRCAVWALASRGGNVAVASLVHCLSTVEPDRASFDAACALAMAKDSRAETFLAAILPFAEAHIDLRVQAVLALRCLPVLSTTTRKGLSAIIQRNDNPSKLRLACAHTLAVVNPSEAIDVLLKCLEQSVYCQDGEATNREEDRSTLVDFVGTYEYLKPDNSLDTIDMDASFIKILGSIGDESTVRVLFDWRRITEAAWDKQFGVGNCIRVLVGRFLQWVFRRASLPKQVHWRWLFSSHRFNEALRHLQERTACRCLAIGTVECDAE